MSPLLSSLCPFLVVPWPQHQKPLLQGFRGLWNRMFPSTRAALALPEIPWPQMWWLADVKGCGWRAGRGHLCQMA